MFELFVLLLLSHIWGVHRSTSLMSSSLLLQQCPACLVRLTWIVLISVYSKYVSLRFYFHVQNQVSYSCINGDDAMFKINSQNMSFRLYIIFMHFLACINGFIVLNCKRLNCIYDWFCWITESDEMMICSSYSERYLLSISVTFPPSSMVTI